MTEKFTEEQYQKIIKAWNSERIYIHQTEAVIDYLIDDLNVDLTLMGDTALAIANPLTREWAYDKFVEKEKKSHFVLKDVRDDNGNLYHLIEVSGAVMLNPWLNLGYHPNIKESDVRKWGFNPDMFDREEV